MPVHAVFGEASSLWLAWGLAILGLALAAVATQLTQDLLAGPAAASRAPHALSSGPLNAARVQEPAAASASAAAPAPAVPAAEPPKPSCPAPVSVYFAIGKAQPDDAANLATELAPLASWAHLHPSARIAVQGHTDQIGADDSNLMLSYKRAKTVATALLERGLAPHQVQIAAAGSHAPVASTPGEARVNRRVTIHIVDPETCQNPTR